LLLTALKCFRLLTYLLITSTCALLLSLFSSVSARFKASKFSMRLKAVLWISVG